LETLNRLLAMDVQQLRGHRGISERAAKELEREEAAIIEEEGYDPEAHIVDEQPDPVYGPGGSDLYEDYYDRLTYEALLRAAGAAIYRPEPRSGSGPEEGTAEESEAPRPTTPPPAKDEPVRQDRVRRITRRFGHLVGNFERGVQDDAYMSQVPPSNFCEIFLVLTTLLRILWLSWMIPDANFLRLSERLFEAFLGDEQQPGGRALTAQRITAEELAKDESRLRLREKSWLHLYLTARRAQAHAEDRLPVLAVIMRRAARELGGPTVLAALPPDSFARIWRHSFSRHRHPVPSIGRVITDLKRYSRRYSESTLARELSIALRGGVIIAPVTLKFGNVPCLRVDAPWRQEDLETYWRGFLNFCRWPKPKSLARMEVYDVNLEVRRYDSKRLIVLFDSDRRELKVLYKPGDNQQFGTVSGNSLQDLERSRGFDEVWAQRKQGVTQHKQA
jgi:hypothetical protein